MTTPALSTKKERKKVKNMSQRTPGGNYYFRAKRMVDGKAKESWISTGTNVASAAAVEVARLRKVASDARRTGRWELMGLAKLRSDLPSIDELQALYHERIAREAVRAPGLQAQREYFRNLRSILGHAKGISPKDAGLVSVVALAGEAGAEVVKSFRVAWLEGVADPKEEGTRRRSGDSMLNQARACFGKEALRCYSEFSLPDFGGFLTHPGFDSEAAQHLDIEPAVLTRIAEAAGTLAEENPRLYLVHLAHKFFGLRNSEIAEARVGWFQAIRWEPEKPIQWMMEISPRLGFRPKASEGSVPLKREVAAELARAWKKLEVDPTGDPLQYLVPAKHATERHDVIYDEHAAFMRRFLQIEDFSKAGYELRRWAFRQVQSKYGSREAAKAFIRHKMPADAGRHYQARFYPWLTLGDDVGISLAEARGGASTMTTAKVEANAWAELA